MRIIFKLKYIVPKFELMHIFGNIKFTLLQEKKLSNIWRQIQKKKIEKRWSSVQNCEEHNNDERRLNISVRLYKANVETR